MSRLFPLRMGNNEAKKAICYGCKDDPYDTRVRIVSAYERRGNVREADDMFGVSMREVYRLAARECERSPASNAAGV